MGIQTATDPQTGKTVALINGAWEPVSDTATNNVGAKAYLVRDKWVVDEPVAEKQPQKVEPKSLFDSSLFGFNYKDLAAGAVRGAGSIGATFVAPYDIASDLAEGRGLTLKSNKERRAKIDEFMRENVGADTESNAYAVGKFGAEMAGTMGTGGVLAKGAQFAGAAPPVVKALETFGMSTGLSPSGAAQYLANLGIRSTAGAATGGAASALVNPEHAATGAAFGAAAPPVLGVAGWGANKLYEGGRNLLAGKEGQVLNYLDKVFPGGLEARKKIAVELMKLKSRVTGERPTSGMAAVSGDVPIPALKAMEEGARARPEMAQAFAARDAANEAARARPLEAIAAVGRRPQVGQNMPEQLSRAEATRKTATAPMYKLAEKDVVVVDDTLNEILGGAQVQDAANRAGLGLRQAVTNALVAGKQPPGGITRGTVTPAYSLPEWAMEPMVEQAVKPTTVTVDLLRRFKAEIGKDISNLKGVTDEAGKTKLAQLTTANSQLDKWIRANSKAYGAAQDTYKLLSEPQNQADVAEALLNALRSPLGIERKAAFANAYRDAARTIQNKAGVPRFEQIGQVMSPTQKRMIDATQASISREAKYAALDAKQSILPEMSSTLDVIEQNVPGFLNKVVTATRKGLIRAGGQLDKESQVIVDRLMLEPKELAAFIVKKTPAEQDQIARYFAGKVNEGAIVNSIVAAQGE